MRAARPDDELPNVLVTLGSSALPAALESTLVSLMPLSGAKTCSVRIDLDQRGPNIINNIAKDGRGGLAGLSKASPLQRRLTYPGDGQKLASRSNIIGTKERAPF